MIVRLYGIFRCRIIVAAAALVFLLSGTVSFAGINEDLQAIDAQIQLDKTPVRVVGQDAYNVYQGVTTNLLEQKRQTLNAAGITNFAWAGNYANFYSFTGTLSYTDSQIAVTTLSSPLRLYRRGTGSAPETARGYLGSWWGDRYRGVQDSRNEQAILAAWGSDLNRIYVIDVPVGTTLIGGIAAPMENNGEYREGGAYQYYYRGAQFGWLVYALYAPDYLKSYSAAVTSAQKTGQAIVTDLAAHLNQVRIAELSFVSGNAGGLAREGQFWLRGAGGSISYGETDGSSVSSQRSGLSVGWQRMTYGRKPKENTRSYFGAMLAQGANYQKYDTSNLENKTQATVGGIYGLYVNRPDSARSWYGNWSLLYGGLKYSNTVPGELGYGLKQDYNGNIMMLTIENGVSFRQSKGWALEPQLQFSYIKISQPDFNDDLGARISLKQGDSVRGRLGIEVRRTIRHDSQRQSSYWAKASFIHDLSKRNEVDIAGDRGISELNRNSYALSVGANMQLNGNCRLQGEVAQVMGSERGLQGNLAVQYAW